MLFSSPGLDGMFIVFFQSFLSFPANIFPMETDDPAYKTKGMSWRLLLWATDRTVTAAHWWFCSAKQHESHESFPFPSLSIPFHAFSVTFHPRYSGHLTYLARLAHPLLLVPGILPVVPVPRFPATWGRGNHHTPYIAGVLKPENMLFNCWIWYIKMTWWKKESMANLDVCYLPLIASG